MCARRAAVDADGHDAFAVALDLVAGCTPLPADVTTQTNGGNCMSDALLLAFSATLLA
jgi:hypothetical protein